MDVNNSVAQAALANFSGTLRRTAGPTDQLWRYRLIDFLCAILLLILTAPVMFATAVAIKLDSRGPIFFAQLRVGIDGHPFRLFKFRSMRVDAEAMQKLLADKNERVGAAFKIRQDPRVTRVGRVIRRLSLDELPQLLNVLLGDMSLVGPRPALPSEVIRYTMDQERRLTVKPGLTGLWQVSGRADLSFEDGVSLDLHYIDNRSPMLNLKIIARTVPAVVNGEGAY